MSTVSEPGWGDNPTGASNQLGEIEQIVSRTVEQKRGQLARSSQDPLSAAVQRRGKHADSPLMFEEFAMAAATGPVAA